MKNAHRGFTLIELITVIILVGVLSIALFNRLGTTGTAAVQASRDDIIAALFFAQQQAMMRSRANNIQVVFTQNTVDVQENNNSITQGGQPYPLTLPKGVSLSTDVPDNKFQFDKLGRTTAGTITLTGAGNSAGVSARIRVEASGYAFAN